MKNPSRQWREGYLVDYTFEISNLDLIGDMANIMNLEIVFSEKRKDNIWS
jgi:hypothetical protein